MADKTVDLSGKVVLRFDGPPEAEGPRFIEAERDGRSINAGDWVQDGDHWLLAIHAANESLLLIQLNGLIDELEGATATCGADGRSWLGYIRSRLNEIVETDASRTKDP